MKARRAFFVDHYGQVQGFLFCVPKDKHHGFGRGCKWSIDSLFAFKPHKTQQLKYCLDPNKTS